jgi:hypothetical protein
VLGLHQDDKWYKAIVEAVAFLSTGCRERYSLKW